MYYDIESRLESMKDPLGKITNILNGSIKKIMKESELGAKINDILSNFESLSEGPSSVKNEGTSVYEKPVNITKIDELQSS